MGSLAAGPDNNSSGYDSEMDELNIKYISQQMCITRRKKKERTEKDPAEPLRSDEMTKSTPPPLRLAGNVNRH